MPDVTNGVDAAKTDKSSKAKRSARRAKNKANKRMLQIKEAEIARRLATAEAKESRKKAPEEEVAITYVAAKDLETANPAVELAFRSIFRKFSTPEQLTLPKKKESEEEEEEEKQKAAKAEHDEMEANVQEVVPQAEEKTLSRREKKIRSRLSIAELKQLVDCPDVVEIHDCNSADPKLLVALKSYPNTVPVPAHWCQRRAYLQGKKGYEKPPFELPAFIAATGITEIRQHQQDKESKQNNKQAQRAKVQPKMNKIDIDYQVLHDAFFRHQTKPNLTSHGNIYYEGKEYETKFKSLKPGKYSAELRRALGMTDDTSPPPWLANMQRFGPPPSWPRLKIPGINTPIPPGARYGVGPGEWGKPPVDDYGVPLYGDVFGTAKLDNEDEAEMERDHWGVLLDEEEEEELVEDEDNEDDEEEEDMESDMDSSLESESSGTSGISTPSDEPLNPRKADGTGTETPEEVRNQQPPALYTVLKQKEVAVGDAVFGSSHTYELPTEADESAARAQAKKSQIRGQVNLSLNPEDLESLDATTLKKKYEQQLQAEKQTKTSAVPRADVEEVIEEHRQKKQRKADAQGGKDKSSKKFKF